MIFEDRSRGAGLRISPAVGGTLMISTSELPDDMLIWVSWRGTGLAGQETGTAGPRSGDGGIGELELKNVSIHF